MAYFQNFVVWFILIDLVVQGEWNGELSELAGRVKMFTCAHLGFLVTYEVSYENYHYISEIRAECSNEQSYLIMKQFGSLPDEELHNEVALIPTPVPELSQCHLKISYRSVLHVIMESNFTSNLTCTLPKTEVTATPSLIINSSMAGAKIHCFVKSSEFVNITWMKNGVILEKTDNLNITYMFANKTPDHLLSVSSISFLSPRLSDSGSFDCISHRTNRNGSHIIDSATCHVDVSLPEAKITSTTTTMVTVSGTVGSTSSSASVVTDDINANFLYGIIGALSFAVVLLVLCILGLTLYCLWLRSTRRKKLTMHMLAIVYPSMAELHDLDFESMKLPEFKILSDSTNSLFATLDCCEPVQTTVETITSNNISHSIISQ